jgi:EAL domain-containing protein (putative c-di-GMP-specific phosphodiesterase class I)
MSDAMLGAADGWFLENVGDGGQLRRIPITILPFRIGRRHGLELVLPADSVSKAHAELYCRGSGLRLRDLGSKNGTFVNRASVEDAPLCEGDVLHFADFEFRLGRSKPDEAASGGVGSDSTAPIKRRELPHGFAEGTRELRELLHDGLVTVVYQPIVLLPHGTVAAYEALGRGRHPQLPESPAELLRIAETIGAEAELSRLFRSRAVDLVKDRAGLPTVFLNTHPIELARPGLIESLEELRRAAPQLALALEIHESVLTRPAVIAELRAMLLEREIALAYDDFGAGQARLLELAEAPPHDRKFDRRFVSGLDQAPLPKKRLLEALLGLARELHVATVAEGVETASESKACAEIGFTHAQGFAIGRPRAVDQI